MKNCFVSWLWCCSLSLLRCTRSGRRSCPCPCSQRPASFSRIFLSRFVFCVVYLLVRLSVGLASDLERDRFPARGQISFRFPCQSTHQTSARFPARCFGRSTRLPLVSLVLLVRSGCVSLRLRFPRLAVFFLLIDSWSAHRFWSDRSLALVPVDSVLARQRSQAPAALVSYKAVSGFGFRFIQLVLVSTRSLRSSIHHRARFAPRASTEPWQDLSRTQTSLWVFGFTT
jgi:hypothetical protein